MEENRVYLQVKIQVPENLAESLSDALMDEGALSVAIQDAFAGTDKEQPIFGEPGEVSDVVWNDSQIQCLFDSDADVAQTINNACKTIGQKPLSYEVETLDDQDWVRLTQSQFDPIQISDRLWITPSWHEQPSDSDAITLTLDPGLAFGTGSHPTTKLCLLWLEENLKSGQTVLDYGCGSGILAIVAAKLGAAEIIGVDIDKQAIIASHENSQKNNTEKIQFMLPDALMPQTFDVLLANILANPLRVLGEMLGQRVKKGGRIVLSGILEEQAEELKTLYSQWFDMDEPVFLDGWTRLTGIKK